MIYILDTGRLVAAFRRPKDPFTHWAAKPIRSYYYGEHAFVFHGAEL